jgi:hypothetical protein
LNSERPWINALKGIVEENLLGWSAPVTSAEELELRKCRYQEVEKSLEE